MKITEIVQSNSLKRSKKREALKKILNNLEKKEKEILKDIESEDSKKKTKKLEAKLKTNKRHRHKANKFIAELE